MRIHTLWKIWDDDSLGLLFALDDATVAENWEAWNDGCKLARKRYGITEADTREAIVTIPRDPIARLFEVPEITGTVATDLPPRAV